MASELRVGVSQVDAWTRAVGEVGGVVGVEADVAGLLKLGWHGPVVIVAAGAAWKVTHRGGVCSWLSGPDSVVPATPPAGPRGGVVGPGVAGWAHGHATALSTRIGVSVTMTLDGQ